MSITVSTEGIHPTTEACIGLLHQLHQQRSVSNVLEIGCGSGVLSLLCAQIWDCRVLAADISAQAVADTQKLMQQAGCDDRVNTLRSDGFSHETIHAHAPYDLIVANLVAGTLIRLVADIRSHLAPGGVVVLSGALSWLAGDVEAALHTQNFTVISKISHLSWNSYILQG